MAKLILIALSFALAGAAGAQNGTQQVQHTKAIEWDDICQGKTCDSCLAEESCVWMKNGTCAESCNSFPDPNCYYPRMFGYSKTNRKEICEAEQELYEDNELCFKNTNQEDCHDEIGCIWLEGVVESGAEAFWCTLHLESTNITKPKHQTYPPFEEAVEEDSPERSIHRMSTDVLLRVLGIYALMPFAWWLCWMLIAYIKRIKRGRATEVQVPEGSIIPPPLD